MNMPLDTSFKNMPLTNDLMLTSPGPQGGGSRPEVHRPDMATGRMGQSDRGSASCPSSEEQAPRTRNSSSFPKALEQAKRTSGQKAVTAQAGQSEEAAKKIAVKKAIDDKELSPQDLAALLATLASQLQAAAEGKEWAFGTLPPDLQKALEGLEAIEGFDDTSAQNPLIALIERAVDLLGPDGSTGLSPGSDIAQEEMAPFKGAMESLLDELATALDTGQGLSDREEKGLIRTLFKAAEDLSNNRLSGLEDLASQKAGKAETAPSADKIGLAGDGGNNGPATGASLNLPGKAGKESTGQDGPHKSWKPEEGQKGAPFQGISSSDTESIKNFTDKRTGNDMAFLSKTEDETIESAPADRAADILGSKRTQASDKNEDKYSFKKEVLDTSMGKTARGSNPPGLDRPTDKHLDLTGSIQRMDNHREGMARSQNPQLQPDGTPPLHTASSNQGPNGIGGTGPGAQNDLQAAGVKISISHQLSQGISEAIRFNRNRAVLHLNPPELGRVRVSLSVTGGNHVNATFIAEHPETRQIIEASMAQLRDQLHQNGFSLGDLNVGLGGRQDSADSSSFFQDLSGSNRHVNEAAGRDQDIRTPEASLTAKGGNHHGMLHVVA